MSNSTRHHLVRRGLTTLALGAALTGGVAGIAHATDANDGLKLGPQQEGSIATWFLGRTALCVKNLEPAGGKDVAYTWWSSSSAGSNSLRPQEEDCSNRAWAGFRFGARNISHEGTIVLYTPFGPN